MNLLAYILFRLAEYWWLVIAAVLLLAWFGLTLLRRAVGQRISSKWLVGTVTALIVLWGNFFPEQFGAVVNSSTNLRGYVLTTWGRPGSGQIVETHDHDCHWAITGSFRRRARIAITGSDGSIYQVGYDDDDNDFRRSTTSDTTFCEGDQFNVRYLQMSPERYLIITDDDSAWARRERCYHLALELSDVRRSPTKYAGPAALIQADNQRYRADNCKAIVRKDYRTSGIEGLETLGAD